MELTNWEITKYPTADAYHGAKGTTKENNNPD